MNAVHSGGLGPVQEEFGLSYRDSSAKDGHLVSDCPRMSQNTQNAQSIKLSSSTGASCLRAPPYETVASCQDETHFSQETSWIDSGSGTGFVGMWPRPLQGRNTPELPIGKRNGPDEYYDCLVGLESQLLGKGKGKAVDLFQNNGLKGFSFEGETDTHIFYDYSSDEDEDDGTPLSDFYDSGGEGPSDQGRSLPFADYFLDSFKQPFSKSSVEHPKFVAGPSRITLDDLRGGSSFQSRHWR